jgi:hypothetical protein
MGRVEDVILQLCYHEDIDSGEEWVHMPADLSTSTSVRITLNRECRQQKQFVVEVEVHILILENSVDRDVIIYMDGSVIQHVCSSSAFTAQVDGHVIREDSGAVAATISSLTMQVMVVSKALSWLETQTFPQACFLRNSMSMLRKIESGWLQR